MRITQRTKRTAIAAAAVAVATATTTVGLVSASATAATVRTTSSAKAAAGWLAGQLTGPHHDHYAVTFGGKAYPDAGETIDGLLGMDAAKVSQRAAARVTKWLQANAKDYATGSGTTPNSYYPGALAKLLLAAEAQHADVHDFGGINLVRALRKTEQPDGAYLNTGDTQYGSSPVAQSLALIALSHTGSMYDWPDAKAIAWLVGQQCGDGGFMSSNQSHPAATCTDVDATAYAAQALFTVRSSATARTFHWLGVHQNSDGGFGLDANGKPSSNANSTAVAMQAELLAHHVASRAHAGAWLRRHQVRCSGATSRRGAVLLSGSAWNHDTALRATTQAAQALAGRWLGSISDRGAIADAPVLKC
jgi:hypothetical protein